MKHPMHRRRQFGRICTRCKIPLPMVATYGGWSPHLCPDRLRSRAFDVFLVALARLDPAYWDHPLIRDRYRRVPPRERPLIHRILAHAGVVL